MRETSAILMKGLSSSQKRIRFVPHLGIFLSLTLILQMVEGMLPPIGMPGIKLGLANVAILLSLQFLGWHFALVLVFLRQVVGGLLLGQLFSIGFYLGLSGGVASILVMQLWLSVFGQKEGLAGASMAGALGHNWGQWVVARWLVGHSGIFWYLPFLTLAALPCGFIVAGITNKLIYAFAKKHAFPKLITAKGIVVLLLPVFLAVGLPLAELAAQPKGALAIVQINGKTELELNLAQEGSWDLAIGDYHYTIINKNGKIRIAKSDCPDQVCVRTGFINQKGKSIVCLPSRLVIYIEDNQEEMELDGFLY